MRGVCSGTVSETMCCFVTKIVKKIKMVVLLNVPLGEKTCSPCSEGTCGGVGFIPARHICRHRTYLAVVPRRLVERWRRVGVPGGKVVPRRRGLRRRSLTKLPS